MPGLCASVLFHWAGGQTRTGMLRKGMRENGGIYRIYRPFEHIAGWGYVRKQKASASIKPVRLWLCCVSMI